MDRVKAATVRHHALAGLAPVDGVFIEAGDVVLVKDQRVPSENGLYRAADGEWFRVVDQVFVEGGAVWGGCWFASSPELGWCVVGGSGSWSFGLDSGVLG